MPIPRVKRGLSWLADQPPSYDFGLAFFAAVVGYSSAIQQYWQAHLRLSWVLSLATTLALVFSLLKNTVTLRAAKRKESHSDLEGCLHTLHSILKPDWEQPVLRIAIHRPVDGGAELEQVTEYIGARPKPGRIGRRFPANAGIIGRAYRERDNFIAKRENDNYEAYVTELIKVWNYTEESARLLNPAVMSWMAAPFYDEARQKVEGVLYLDSTEREFFTEARQEIVLKAVAGIAGFVKKRYT